MAPLSHPGDRSLRPLAATLGKRAMLQVCAFSTHLLEKATAHELDVARPVACRLSRPSSECKESGGALRARNSSTEWSRDSACIGNMQTGQKPRQ